MLTGEGTRKGCFTGQCGCRYKMTEEGKEYSDSAIISKQILIKEIGTLDRMAWIARAVDEFQGWRFRNLRNEEGCSAAMKIDVGPKKLFRKKKTHSIFIYETPESFVVSITDYRKAT